MHALSYASGEMGRTAETSPTGLRERKKVQTRAAIAEAADELFEAQGFAATTIPQIAERAQVSPRTVSYYFPVKEELVFPDRGELIEGLAATLDDREHGETAADALSRWITDMFVQQPAEEKERSLKRRAVIDADAGLRAYELEMQSHAEEVIAASFARDLNLPADHHVPRMIAAATLAALGSLGREDKHPADPAEAQELIDDVMTFISAGARGLGSS